MKVNIDGTSKEIADLIVSIQEKSLNEEKNGESEKPIVLCPHCGKPITCGLCGKPITTKESLKVALLRGQKYCGHCGGIVADAMEMAMS